jgi:hypothetical protein
LTYPKNCVGPQMLAGNYYSQRDDIEDQPPAIKTGGDNGYFPRNTEDT